MELIKTAPRLPPVQVRLLLNEAYDETYGIAKHDVTSGPSSLFAVKDAEDTFYNNGLYERMENFSLRKVGVHFNISFKDFLNQAPYVCDMMLEVSAQRCKEDAEYAEAAARASVNKMGKK